MPVFIDRSNVNGGDDYKAAPTTHLYLKVSEGTSFVDATYTQRRAQGKAAGAKVGGYHFGSSHSSGASQADFFLGKLGTPQDGDLKPCLDFERAQDGTTMSATQAADFAERVHAKLGYYPVLYGSTSIVGPIRSNATLRKCPWWRAEYGPNDGQRHALQGGDQGAAAHQYTSAATVPGISGHTDRSEMIDEKAMTVGGVTAVVHKKFVALREGHVVKDFRRRSAVALWIVRRRQPRHPGDQITIKHRDD